tara:strand:+ start:1295 stop:2587 length:1293 start_codon:yes stop_codon:yes gene_type:complete
MKHPEIINEARECVRSILSTPEYNQGKGYNEIGTIWQDNINIHLDDILNNSKSLEELFTRLNRHTFYDINFGPRELIEASVKWRLRNLSADSTRKYPQLFSESSLIGPDRIVEDSGCNLSSDLVWRLSIINRVAKHIQFPTDSFSILEIGGGYGAFSRALKTVFPHCKYIIVDLPHSLSFQYCFLKHSFPNSNHLFVTSNSTIDFSNSDFIYLPHKWLHLLGGQKIFLAANTNSFAEMPLTESTRYINFIQDSLEVDYLFSLNRLLNRVDNSVPSRELCVGHSFQYDRKWHVLDWEVDPDYERCPILTTLLTRNLHLIMKRQKTEDTFDQSRLTDIELEDWNTRPFWERYELQLNGEVGVQYPPVMTRGDRELTPDLTSRGTLFNLWDYLRLSEPDSKKHAHQLLLRYLVALGGSEKLFEEIPFLLDQVS